MGQFADAYHHLDYWKARLGSIENSFVLRLGSEVQGEIESLNGAFVVAISAEKINPKSEVERFHRFCCRWAREKVGHMGNDEDAARLLGIAVATFYRWAGERLPTSKR